MGESSFRSVFPELKHYDFGSPDLSTLGVHPNHLGRQNGRISIRQPGRIDTAERLIPHSKGTQVSGVAQRGPYAVLRMSRRRSLEAGSLLAGPPCGLVSPAGAQTSRIDRPHNSSGDRIKMVANAAQPFLR